MTTLVSATAAAIVVTAVTRVMLKARAKALESCEMIVREAEWTTS